MELISPGKFLCIKYWISEEFHEIASHSRFITITVFLVFFGGAGKEVNFKEVKTLPDVVNRKVRVSFDLLAKS